MQSFLRVMAVLVLVLTWSAAVPAVGAAEVVQTTGQVSAADATAFLGEWTLALQGPNGPGTFTLSITTDKEKVAAEISSERLDKQPISTISRAEKSLVLGFSFTYEGNPVDAVVTLTPDQDGKMAAQIDFAGGAYVMTGPATKKEKDKDTNRAAVLAAHLHTHQD
jgi:hypothetical protein